MINMKELVKELRELKEAIDYLSDSVNDISWELDRLNNGEKNENNRLNRKQS